MDLIEQYQAMHEAGHFGGHSMLPHVDQIKVLIKKYDAKTLLDYGSGRGEQYADGRVMQEWGIQPTLYDPAVPWLANKPIGGFDGVICTDVLEHLEMPDADLLWIFKYAMKFAFFSICCRPAKKILPDGRNCHLTVQPQEWWLLKIESYAICPYEVAWND